MPHARILASSLHEGVGEPVRKLRRDVLSDFTHVTQRGIGRRIIFEDDEDKRFFLDTLAEKKPSDMDLVAWCLMDNHMHLLFRAGQQTISKLMQRAQTSYAQHFNGRHGHVGKVFQSRFASTPIKTGAHLLAAIRYIHRNALDAGASSFEDHPWSSYRQIAGIAPCEGASACDGSIAIAMFGDRKSFIAFHEDNTEVDDLYDVIGCRPRISDNEARAIARHQFGDDFASRLTSMPKQQRNASLKTLKVLGLSIRQIERLTGIGRNIIARAK